MSTDHGAVPGPETGTGGLASRPAPVPVPSTEDGTAVLAPVGTPVPSSAMARAGTALRYHARELWLDPGRLLHSLYHGRPLSVAGYAAYVKSAAWVPKGMTGKPRTFWTWAGFIYQALIGCPLTLVGKALGAAAPYPLAVIGIAVFAVILIVLL